MPVALALLTVVSTMIGGVVALRARDRMHLVLGASAGILLGLVAFDLLPEVFRLGGVPEGVPGFMVAFVLGFLVLHVLERASGVHEPADSEYGEHHHRLSGTIGTAGLIGHSFLDGLGIGLAFQVSTEVGWAVAIAVLAHDFADGLNTVTLMRRAGHTQRRQAIALGLDAIAPLVGVLVALLLSPPGTALALYLGAFAGLLTYLATAEILPEAHAHHPSRITLLMTLGGVAFMYVVASFA
ncbi:MAG TPA: ZIP family metal transporter [Candidatus Nanopelagicales bacterium]|nr:ZIP family metal transporter [Candidatus Nanopelagicales bacterium]